MQRIFKYRLYPNRQQRETLAAQVDMCRELYNAALQERIESYKTARKGVTWLQQQSQLPAIKEVRPEFKSVHAHVLHSNRGAPRWQPMFDGAARFFHGTLSPPGSPVPSPLLAADELSPTLEVHNAQIRTGNLTPP